MDGQLTIYDLGKKKRPCDYSFQRYIGQNVFIHTSKGPIKGRIDKIEPYYTYIKAEDKELYYAGTPYNVSPAEGSEKNERTEN